MFCSAVALCLGLPAEIRTPRACLMSSLNIIQVRLPREAQPHCSPFFLGSAELLDFTMPRVLARLHSGR